MKKIVALVLVLSLSLAMLGSALAAYPERSINLTVPFGAGGGTDVWARAVANKMGEILGQTIICTNVTGGSAGSTGVDSVWKAPHDGYTLCGTSETPLTIPVMTPLTQTAKDWTYFIAAGSPGLLCINKNSEYKTMEEVLAAVKDGKDVSIAGTTGGLWFALAKLFDSYGEVPFTWIPYDGSATAIKGCVAGETDVVVASAGEVKDFVRAGDLIPLCAMQTEGWTFPEIGEIKSVIDYIPALEQYLPLNQVLGFKVPADTDPAIVEALTKAFNETMASEEIKSYADEQLCVIYGLAGEEANTMMTAIESKLCWVLDDMGQTTFSPDERGIAKP